MKEKLSMKEMSIERRLENWGYCQRGRSGGLMLTQETRRVRRVSPYGGQGYQCMTNVICTRMREAANGPKGGLASQAKLDFEDAAVIHRAWMQLGMKHRQLLHRLYVLAQSENAICRQLDIKHWPPAHFNRERSEAKDAIQKFLDS